MPVDISNLRSFAFEPGKRLAGKYVVGELLGAGWEGEVYHVTEIPTGVERAAKFFFPVRNPMNRAMNFYAKKLNKLRRCSIVVQYHTQEFIRFRGHRIPFLVSEYVEGELLNKFIERQPGRRLHHFEALHLFRALVTGIEEIHRAGEYHGDLHSENVIVRRQGIEFHVNVVDFYQWGRFTSAHALDDLCGVVRILYDAVGGAKYYAKQPGQVKEICCGLKRSLIQKKFRNATGLRKYLETMKWD